MSGPLQSDNFKASSEGSENFEELDLTINPAQAKLVPESVQSRWQEVVRLNWTDANPDNSTLWHKQNFFTDLFHSISGGASVHNLLRTYKDLYRSFKSDVEIRVTIQGGFANYGMLMIASCPRGSSPNIATYMADPKKIFLSTNDPGTATYILTQKRFSYLDTQNVDNWAWGRFGIFVLASLKNSAGSAVQPVTILVEARPHNMKVKIPTCQIPGPAAPSGKESSNLENSSNPGIKLESSSAIEEAKRVAEKGMLAAGARSLGRVAIKAAKPILNAVHPILPTVLDMLPFSRPIDTSNLYRSVEVSSDVFTQVNGSTVSRRAGLAPTSPLPALPQVDGKDYSRYENYFGIESLVSNFYFTASVPTDQVVGSFPVTPIYTGARERDTDNNLKVAPGPMQWGSFFHGFWRGGLKYKLLVTAPTGSSMVMRVTHDRFPLTAVNSKDAGNTHNAVFDIQGSHVFEFETLYSGDTPYLPMAPHPEYTSWPSNARPKFCDGFINLSMVTPPRGPMGNPITVTVTVLVSAGQNFELGLPLTCQPVAGVTYEGKSLFDGQAVAENGMSLVEKIDNWRDFYKMGVAISSPDLKYWIPSELAYTFNAVRGSQRRKIKAVGSDAGLRIMSPTPGGHTRVGPLVLTLSKDRPETLELAYPYTEPYVRTDRLYNPPPDHSWFEYHCQNLSNEQVVSFTDDIQLFWPTAPPMLKMAPPYI